MRSLFTKKTTLKTVPRVAEQPHHGNGSFFANESNETNNSLAQILALPLPKIFPDTEYDNLDIYTAASLNSESIQCFIGSINTPIASTSVPYQNDCHDQTNSESTVNLTNIHKWTPLMYAAYLGHKEMSELLLSRGADTEIRNDNGQTSLMMASSCGSADVVDVLLQYSAKINVKDKFGRTPLHYAIKYNQAKIALILLEKGANPNLSDSEGMTPTLMACEVGNEATLTTLLQYKGDIFRRNKKNENGITLAGDQAKILTILKQQKTSTLNKNENLKNYELSFNKKESVNNLLKELGLEKYTKIFQDFKINNLTAFSNITNEKLDEMGITLFGPQKKILDAVQLYRQHGTFGHLNELANSKLTLTKNTNINQLQQKFQELYQDSIDKTVCSSKIEEFKTNLTDCHQELQNLKKTNALKTQALHEIQILLKQTYSILKQTLTTTKSDSSSIKTLLKQIEQNDIKLNNILKE